MTTRPVSEAAAALIDQMVESGAYASAEQVIDQAVALLAAEEARIKAKIREGLADANAGRTMPLDDAMRKIRATLDAEDVVAAE